MMSKKQMEHKMYFIKFYFLEPIYLFLLKITGHNIWIILRDIRARNDKSDIFIINTESNSNRKIVRMIRWLQFKLGEGIEPKVVLPLYVKTDKNTLIG